MLPMPILACPWISILDSMPTGMSQRDLSRVSTFCGVGANKLGEQHRFLKRAGRHGGWDCENCIELLNVQELYTQTLLIHTAGLVF